MGLDMYLMTKAYVSRNDYKDGEKTVRPKFTAVIEAIGFDRSLISEDAFGLTVEVPVAYWRKANAIHKWFVDHVQAGVDDCGTYYVSEEQLRKLRDLCEAVLGLARTKKGKVANGTLYTRGKAGELVVEHQTRPGEVVTNAVEMKDLLPTQYGLFFGSTDYDDGYLSDVRYTKQRLDLLIEKGVDCYYHSSW